MGKHLMVREWLVQMPCGGRQQLCAGPQRYPEKRNVERQVIVRLFLAKQASLKMLFFKNNCFLKFLWKVIIVLWSNLYCSRT